MAATFLVKQQDGGLLGPVSAETLRDLFAAGQIPKDAVVSKDKGEFIPITALSELRSVLHKAATWKAPVVPTYSGFFTDHSFMRVLYRLCIAKETGRLLATRDNERKELFLIGGSPVFVGSNIPGERIGEYLVEQGAITRQQLEDALVILGNFGNHLGNTLMGMKVISPHAFYEHLLGQLRLKIHRMILYTDGRYDFFKGVTYEGPKLPIELDALGILSEGVRSLLDKESAEKRLGPRGDLPLHHAKNPLVRPARLGLNGFEQLLYDNMNGGKSPHELARDFADPDGGRTALALSLYLLDIGVVEVGPPR